MYTFKVRLSCRHDKEDYESEIIFFNHLLFELIKDNFKYFVNRHYINFLSHYWDTGWECWVIPIELMYLSGTTADEIKTCIQEDPAIRSRLVCVTVSA